MNDIDNYYKSKYDVYYYVLTMDREKLYDRIKQKIERKLI